MKHRMKPIVFTVCIWLTTLTALTLPPATENPSRYPVVFDQDTLFYIDAKLGSLTPSERAQRIQEKIRILSRDMTFETDSLYLVSIENYMDIMYGDLIIMTVAPSDTIGYGISMARLAQQNLDTIKTHITEYRHKASPVQVLIRVGWLLLILAVLYFLLRFLNRIFRYLRDKLIQRLDRHLKGIKVRDYELVGRDTQIAYIGRIIAIIKVLFFILIVYMALPLIFSLFPWTEEWSRALLGFIFNPVKKIFWAIVDYFPKLITIIIIYFAFKYLNKLIKFLKDEIQNEKLNIPGFYPDWAEPTYRIVNIILNLFMFIVIFPYLPGSESPIFRGVSIFFGFLISFGSSSAIANAIAGIVITYMRPYRVGDRIKIGDVTGDVVEKSLLVTRLKTIKNEIVTVPNSSVLSGNTVNYTSMAVQEGVIIHTTITIGYDAPWRKVHELLITAALETNGIMKKKKPFVLQTSLDDFYVSYQINAFTDQPHRMAVIYSDLHQHIQDKFNEGDVEIMSPHYRSLRDGNLTTIPGDYLPPEYEKPGFTIESKIKEQKAKSKNQK